MNGSQHANDTLAQKSPQGASIPAAAANGNSAINKKRKKDGLKPIITTEGPGYVHCAFCPAAARINRCLVFPCPVSRRPIACLESRVSGFTGSGSRSFDLANTLRSACRPSARWRGATGGPWDPRIREPIEGKKPTTSVPMRSRCDITQRRRMGMENPPAPKGKGGETSLQIFWACVLCGSRLE